MKTSNELLHNMAECFFRGSLNFSLRTEDFETMTWDWQQEFLDLTVNSQLLKQYPLSSTFRKLFFKKLLPHLENQEVHDDFYTHLCHSMNEETANDFCYRHYVIGSNLKEIISIKETNKMVVDGTTGMRTWEAALMLADWAITHAEIFSNKKVLELGSGVGFTGVAVAKHCGPSSIYLTDFHSGVIRTICDNIQINFPKISEEENNGKTIFRNSDQTVGAMILDWNAIEQISCDVVPDIVIGADIVYDPVIIQPLCDVLKTFFSRNKKLQVYIASVIRNMDTFQAFLNSLESMNFSFKKIPLEECSLIKWDMSVQKCLLHIEIIK